jgi:3-oxoadipate enol-lactonase
MSNIDLKSGLTIHYSDLNPNGNPVVLLLHGLGATGESWQMQFPALIDAGFRILAPDMRGFGKSTYPGGSNNSQLMAKDMVALLENLAIRSTQVIGISMGGTIALQLILDQPSMIDSLVLTNTFAKLRPQKFSLWFFYAVRLALVHIFGMTKQADFVARRLFPDPKQAQLREAFKAQVIQANPSGYRSTMRSYTRFDLSNQVNSIRVPTLIITGERDSVVPPEVQIELANQIPDAKHVFIPDAGHAVSVEQPEEYNQIILAFLRANTNLMDPDETKFTTIEEIIHA